MLSLTQHLGDVLHDELVLSQHTSPWAMAAWVREQVPDLPLFNPLETRSDRCSRHPAPLNVSTLYRLIKSFLHDLSLRQSDATIRETLRHASTHWLRHTFAKTALKATGSDLQVVQKLLDHASVATTGQYVRSSLDEAVVAAAKTAALLDLHARPWPPGDQSDGLVAG
jgi:integrase